MISCLQFTARGNGGKGKLGVSGFVLSEILVVIGGTELARYRYAFYCASLMEMHPIGRVAPVEDFTNVRLSLAPKSG
jgi:hypothetical protein